MSQIVYTYGLLQYLIATDDKVFIIGKDKKITPKEYINKLLPALLESYLSMDEEQKAKIYFPLINILLSIDQKEDANIYLKKALNLSASISDFLMLKHFCKLISLSEYYSTREKKSIYQRICGYFHYNVMPPWQLKDYSRNIGDIKYILLTENNFPTLVFNVITNIFHSGLSKLSTIVSDIFKTSDKYNATSKRDIRIELSRNSPIMISIQFTETIENVFLMLRELIILTCYVVHENHLQLKKGSPFANYMLGVEILEDVEINQKLLMYQENKLSLTLSDFHIENWKQEYKEHFLAPINFVNSTVSVAKGEGHETSIQYYQQQTIGD